MLDVLLRQMRESAGLTVPSVAGSLEVPRSTAYSWEHPGSRPEPEALQRLLDLYGASDEQRLEAWRLRALPREASDPPSTETETDTVAPTEAA